MDETKVAVTAGEPSPIVSGIVYRNTIAFCRDAFEPHRAQEWDAGADRVVRPAGLLEMPAHQGLCLVHRAEVMTLAGEWDDALAESDRGGAAPLAGAEPPRRGPRRISTRGDPAAARRLREVEAAYGEAARLGREPQPGLALLRLAQGDTEAAVAGIRRAVMERPSSPCVVPSSSRRT